MLGLFLVTFPVLAMAAMVPAARPAELNAYSSSFVRAAIEARRTGVSPKEASSVASVMFSRGVEPTQVTEMLQMGDRLLGNIKSINAISLSELASVFASAYTSMHTRPEYSDFVRYVKAHSSIYYINKIAAAGTTMQRAGSENRRALISIYGSLMENSNGRHALETFSEVLARYMKDFGVSERGGLLSVADVVYNLI